MPGALVFYHYYYPDDVVSAVHLSELCEELVRRGWKVTVRPCNQSCRNSEEDYPLRERWKGVLIRRIWRPAFNQASGLGRIANAAWMMCCWSWSVLHESPDFVIVGTDPIFSVILALVWKTFRPRTRVAHWCFDLYPELAIADGVFRENSLFLKLLKPLLRRAYRSCDLLADIGCCMRKSIDRYQPRGAQVTLTPWALHEPIDALPHDAFERRELFGDASLALLYSGSFGRAHASDLVLQLMRQLEPAGAHLAFSIRGNRAEALRKEAQFLSNVSFVPFAPHKALQTRLSAADIHVVTLRDNWTGNVVPSKFFGALAAGRPVLYSGSPHSSIAVWIREYQVGWVLTKDTLDSVASEMLDLCRTRGRVSEYFSHCHAVYRDHFSRSIVADEWNRQLRNLLIETRAGALQLPAST
jgi:glycosyltransferase involved in cell wall biosynthesis